MARTFGNLIQKYPIRSTGLLAFEGEWVKTSDVPLFALLGISICLVAHVDSFSL